MTGDYPRFKASYTHEELVEHFLLSPAEHALVDTCRGDVNRHGVAVLLKAVQYLGYFPDDLQQVPEAIRTFIAHQLQLLWDHTADYPRHHSTREVHMTLIRQHTGFRFPTGQDKQALETWLHIHGAVEAPTEEDLCECAYARLRALGLELPAESELWRIVRAALHSFFDDLYQSVTAQLSETVRTTLDALLMVASDEGQSAFDQLKAEPSAPGVKPLQQEVAKLQALRANGVPAEALAGVPFKVRQTLKRRAHNERAGEMRVHPAPIRYTLLACFIHVRTMEVTDDVVRMLLEIIRRIETQTEKHLHKALLRDIKRVVGKVQILFRVAEAVVEAPGGTIREVLFPRVGEATFRELVAEAKASGPQYRLWYQYVMRQKYVRHYRRMLPMVLEHLTFRSENRFQPVIDALAVIKQYLGTRSLYLPDEVPIEGVVLPRWRDTVLEHKDGHVRVNRRYYELCVLQQLERALKCKEIWVEGSYAFRNPSQDMPANWEHEEQRTAYYRVLPQPVEVTSFIDPLRERLTTALTGFTRFFTHSGTKEVRSREALRPLLLLDLFAEGTNTGITRVAKANHQYSYDELLYVRKHYLSVEALRHANAAIVNQLLALRDPRLWGEGHACASDGKRFESWSQNLMTEWRSRYRGYGVLVYWHVETNAVCIYSQLRNFSFSEVAAMIEGLIRHDTEMRVEKNFVDSHGQSEVAFAFCHLLGTVRLMPRLKRLKYERLYLPDKGTADDYPHMAGTFARPIRWDLMEQQYDEMVKATVALTRGTATAEAILKRYHSYNVTHPTYKALAEVGKAEKSIFLCDYLRSRETQHEIHEGLNVVENWNATNDCICYGRQGELATNSREQQEIVTLSLQLLQNCLMFINTLLLEQTIERDGFWERLSEDDRRALTP